MTESFEARCLRCGAPDPGDRARCVCGASLLVDVLLKEPVADERRRFALARALAVLGPPAPAFSQARTSLAIPGDRLVRGISRAFAQKSWRSSPSMGPARSCSPRELPVEPSAAAAPRSSARGFLVGVLAVVVLAGAAYQLWISQSDETRKAWAFGLGVPSWLPRRPRGLPGSPRRRSPSEPLRAC